MPEALPKINWLLALFALGLMAAVASAWIGAIIRLAMGLAVLPAPERRAVPWGSKSVLGVILLWLGVQIAIQGAFVYATRGTVGPPAPGQERLGPSAMMIASAVQNAAVLLIVPLFLASSCGARPRDFGLTVDRAGRRFLQGVAAWPLAAPLVFGAMLVAVAIWGREAHPLEKAIQGEGLGRNSATFFLAGAVLAPAAEELIFRGILLGWLTTLVLRARRPPSRPTEEGPAPDPEAIGDELEPARTSAPDLQLDAEADFDVTTGPGPVEGADEVNPFDPPRADLMPPALTDAHMMLRLGLANVGVSALFAALHAAVWPTPVPIFFLSLVLGLLYQRTGSLLPPVALHMTFNGISTIMMFLAVGGAPKDGPTAAEKPIPVPSPQPAPLPKPIDPARTP